ncbi:Variant surface glycoprotein [Trypanosoma congolense IL3000]|uniref:Variant surface glycoprotein n=1 Tax=Trypanosoma congolense (strain IL3000) TaxID=1068625 RepID=F9WFG7_TRYCI|nr:Variant surface glycoprotein [Trypanosoma congolense IL3000]
MLKFWMVAIGGVVIGMLTEGTSSLTKENLNIKEHNALCEVLGAAVSLWDRVKDHNTPLKKALAQAIFGAENANGDIAGLIGKMPQEYNEDGDRHNWCGECSQGATIYPGISIPHDLLCMCTVGHSGAPFNVDQHHSLCGVEGEKWGCTTYKAPSHHVGEKKHWECSGKKWNTHWDKDRRQMAWEKVVKPCLDSLHRTNLRDALKSFRTKKSNNQIPNMDRHSNKCGGTHGDICVKYSGWCGKSGGSEFPQWLDALNDLTDADFNVIERTTAKRRTRRESSNDTTLSGTDEATFDNAEDPDTHSSQVRTTAHTQEATQSKIFSSFPKQESSTTITQTSSGLISAVFLI